METTGHMPEPGRTKIGLRAGGDEDVARNLGRQELLHEHDTALDEFAIWFLDRLIGTDEAGR